MPSLSICVFANNPPARLGALLSPLRGIADEIVVAIDDSTGDDDLSPLDGIADKTILARFVWPLSASLAWLHEQCSSEWILRLDGDEFASSGLLDVLAGGSWHKGVTHCFIPRKWLVDDGSSWIQSNPWWPDPQLRLVKNDPSIINSGTTPHEWLQVEGPTGVLGAPIFHTDLVDNTLATRRSKARRYFREQPQMRAHTGHTMNVYYTPELAVPRPQTRPVAPEDRPLVQSVLENNPLPPPKTSKPLLQKPESAQPGQELSISLIEPDSSGYAGAGVEFLANVTNTGSIPLDPHGPHPVRVGGRWFDSDRDTVIGEARADLPGVLEPGASLAVVLASTLPTTPGDYTLNLAGVAEGSHWFDSALEISFTTVEQPTIPLDTSLGTGTASNEVMLEDIADRFPHLHVVRPVG